MPRFTELDPRVTLADQLDEGGGPVVLVNILRVAPEDVDQLLLAWSTDAAALKKQPGFISTQLYRGIAGSSTFLNHAVWESTAHYRTARLDTTTRAAARALYPPSLTATPHLFRKHPVPGICVA
ncbi:antibiotic biosynthesis monooxygenase family protein [Actinacidiphila guanduensis]|uniref:Antibiotic biosynthesis monooxygenase n=1 Tax=Actinacidiphila guanduensis TaxID=310781 RepID=A0A1H0A9W4_9ACTN|nr:antibiotic biosynthesis monooxygenase family protein [Actinacidiphila guanduensis]SDN30061.1 Antibiotic biosynthesis monooxygenase [Actinacidiphila guanduensis]